MAGKQQKGTLATALRFIASLIFLYVVFVAPPASTSSGISAAALWAPIAYAVAVVGAVALFFASLVGFGWSSETLAMGAGKAVTYTAVALLVLAAINGGTVLTTAVELIIVGFIIGWFGGAVEKK